ncbi:unnamed protein product [Lactuca virosa]|uniref:Uncharacterized protein n=1 Tax=Lactuca virosa TaxID=75947 RepID=A0AAU9LG75_9ASTR|nr:unnamed protein product [Lactuca virosa]
MTHSLFKFVVFAMLLFPSCVLGVDLEKASKNAVGAIENQIQSTISTADEGHACKQFIDCNDYVCPPWLYAICWHGKCTCHR